MKSNKPRRRRAALKALTYAFWFRCFYALQKATKGQRQARGELLRSPQARDQVICPDGMPIFLVSVSEGAASAHSAKFGFRHCVHHIQAFEKAKVRLAELESLRLIDPVYKSKYKNRIGKYGSAVGPQQDEFTVACSFSHRRVWELIVTLNISKAVVLEGDAVPATQHSFPFDRMQEVDPTWEYMNLGRCWDYCDADEAVAHFGERNDFKILRSVNSLCTHSYAISKAGAETLLQYSLPHITSVDVLSAMLYRQGLLNSYSVSPPLWAQLRSEKDHDKTQLPECDYNVKLDNGRTVSGEETANAFLQQVYEKENQLLSKHIGHWIRDLNSISQTAPRPHKKRYCSTHQHCVKLGGPRTNASNATAMHSLNIEEVIVWGLRRDRTNHTHSFMHESIYEAFFRLLDGDATQRSLCWLEVDDFRNGCMAENALIIMSPKHSAWTNDPSFTRLPISVKNYYIVHDFIPPVLQDVERIGRVVTWFTWGPDGNFPFLDSKVYVSQRRVREVLQSCSHFVCKSVIHKMFVSMWGSKYSPSFINNYIASLPAEILKRRSTRRINFVGSLWAGNEDAFHKFSTHCPMGAHFMFRGERIVSHWYHFGFYANQKYRRLRHQKQLPRSITDELLASSMFIPAFQGSVHIDEGAWSYIPDRVLNAAALGQIIATNNPVVNKLLIDFPDFVVYDADLTKLCAKAVRRATLEKPVSSTDAMRLAMFVRDNHTFDARINQILDLLLDIQTAGRADS